MQKLVVGAKVEVISYPTPGKVGKQGIIREITTLPFPIHVSGIDDCTWFLAEELKRVPKRKPRAPGTPGINTTKGNHQTTQATPDHG